MSIFWKNVAENPAHGQPDNSLQEIFSLSGSVQPDVFLSFFWHLSMHQLAVRINKERLAAVITVFGDKAFDWMLLEMDVQLAQ